MKVVLDSNVVIAAFASRGLCADVFEHCLYEQTVILSEPLLEEIHRNLCRKIKIPKTKADEIRKFLLAQTKIVEPTQFSKDVCRDVSDVVILGTAAAGEVDVIVTGDADLLILKKFCSIPILNPRGFWAFAQKKGKDK